MNNGVDKYLSPVSGKRTTIVFPLFSLLKASLVAALIAAQGITFDNTGDDAGSTATILIFGFLLLRYSPTPEIVPPVPTPATNISPFLSKSLG